MQRSEKGLPLQQSLRLTSPRLVYTIMAKSRVTTNPMYKGGAGGYTFYVRGGEQVIRQRKNNSNYGDTASRTRAQMIRRIRWGNLVNVFKAISTWQKKAYDSKMYGQTDYNIFMQLNINHVTVAESKEMCEAGCAVVEDYQVSRGSLAPIQLEVISGSINYASSINLSGTITGTTTVGQLSADILANNPEFLPGDNIAIIFMRNYQVPRVEWPYASSVYTEITLDASSTKLLSSITNLSGRLNVTENDTLGIVGVQSVVTNPLHEVGAVMIHTRKSASDLKVSSQNIVMADQTLITAFSGADWDEQCILSYGLTEDAPLEPSFKYGTIQRVTANGVDVENADSLSGSQTVRIYGEHLEENNVHLDFNGVRFTPLVKGDGYYEYILSVNGTARIYSGDYLLMSFTVTDIVVPEELPSLMRTYLRSDSSEPAEHYFSAVTVCTNYPYMVHDNYTNFVLQIGSQTYPFTDSDSDSYTLHNCTVNIVDHSVDHYVSLIIAPVDSDAPVWVEWFGFIIFVGNYTT